MGHSFLECPHAALGSVWALRQGSDGSPTKFWLIPWTGAPVLCLRQRSRVALCQWLLSTAANVTFLFPRTAITSTGTADKSSGREFAGQTLGEKLRARHAQPGLGLGSARSGLRGHSGPAGTALPPTSRCWGRAVLLSCVVCSEYHIPFVYSVRSNFTFLSITHCRDGLPETWEHWELFSQTLSFIPMLTLEERS